MQFTLTIAEVSERILDARRNHSLRECLLVAVSGIDGCGKGYVTKQIVDALNRIGLKAIGLNIDGWLNLPSIRFSEENRAQHFYNHAIRFDEMFSQLILPLKKNRSVDVTADFAEETAIEYKKHRYQYSDIDVVVLEGIFLLKKAFCNYFDMTVWIDCTFETALERAIARSQEGLSPAETIEEYQHIYFPAQELHFAMDDPRKAADFIIRNDHHLSKRRIV